jgi:hypothetical protein
MPHRYPDFARVISIDQTEGKRYSLEIALDGQADDPLLVIQKNPSRADAQVSDHTVNRVLRYLHYHRGQIPWLRNIGRVVFLNLIPWYETYSENLTRIGQELADPGNLTAIAGFASTGGPCIIGWGNPPKGLKAPYAELSEQVLGLLRMAGNPVFHVGTLTRLGYPRHGQFWGYRDPMQPL